MRGLLLFLLCALLVGCGGNGGGDPQPSVFAGQYSGEWQELSEFQGQDPLGAGSITFSITIKGQVSGVFTETLPQQRTGTVSGKVKADGELAFSVAFPGSSVNYIGDVEKANGSIDGSFSEVGVGYGGFFPFFHLEPSDL